MQEKVPARVIEGRTGIVVANDPWRAICEIESAFNQYPRTRMSSMPKNSVWCGFLVVFGLTIGSIHTLGWWARQVGAQAPTPRSAEPSRSSPDDKKHLICAPKHWRAQMMHQ